MAVVENTGAADLATNAGASSRNPDGGADLDRPSQPPSQQQKSLPGAIRTAESDGLQQGPVLRPHQDPASFPMKANRQQQPMPLQTAGHGPAPRSNGGIGMNGVEEGFKSDMKDLEELLSKLNPMAEEFVPPSLSGGGGGVYPKSFGMHDVLANGAHNGFANGAHNGSGVRPKKNSYNQGKRRMNSRTSMAQRAERIRKTVYVSDIDQLVTEEELAALFHHCGVVMDCRVCCDPNSVLRFAFIEFTSEDGARAALELSGTVLGYYPVRVLPSKTAIAPIDPKFLPMTPDEREMCTRTIYCTNIDKKATQTDLKLFFEQMCGEVHRLRLLGDYHHSTRIAFVEFAMAESAIAALNCSGVVLGSLPLRVSPSKTPVCPRSPRPPMH